jgi:predicted Zn-dependent protease
MSSIRFSWMHRGILTWADGTLRSALFTLVVALVSAPGLHAQFGLDKIDFGGLKKAVDTAKDVGKMAKGVTGIGPEEERVIGGSVAVEIVSAYGGLVRDEAIMRRVNLVGRTLARYSDRPDLDWRFGVLASDTVNAFSGPSGYVFITRGLYALADDDDQLAAVLGHEIAHITERHALKIVARGEFMSGLTNQLSQRSSDVRKVQDQLQQFDLGIGQITKTLLEAGFDPQTEYTADRKGHDLAVLTGFAPDGLRLVLVRLQQQPEGPQKIFPTHPPLAERIKRLPDGGATGSAN